MKIYKATVTIIDFDGIGADGIIETIENTRYPNHCMMPRVIEVESRDIGEWSDDHPLNQIRCEDEIKRLFQSSPSLDAEKCSTCKTTVEEQNEFCSDSFHLCRDCTMINGKVVKTCINCSRDDT